MRVLVFQGWVDPAGRDARTLLRAWPTLPGMASAVGRAGTDVTVVAAARRDERVEADGVRYLFVAERAGWSPRRLAGHRAAPHPARSLGATAALRPDLIHMHGLSFPRHAAALRALHPGVPLLVQDHADTPPAGWRRPLHRRGYAGLDGVAFTSREMVEPFHEAGILPRDTPVFEVPEGSSTFAPGDREAARRALGLCGAPVVAWVGGLTPLKDPFTALEAFRHAAGALPDARLWMAHRSGALEGAVRARVEGDEVLAPRVRLLGALPHERVETLLRGADVLLAPSRREGSGYAVIEALACGTPVAASAIPPHRALLGPGGAGAVAPPGDAAALGAALLEIAGDAGPRRLAARRRFEDALSWDRIGETLMGAYDDLLARRGRRARA